MDRQALLQEPFQLRLCDSGVTTKVEFIHDTSVMAEPLESQVTPAERKQVASREGEIGDDLHLEQKTLEHGTLPNGIITSISSERERREGPGSVPMARAISVRIQWDAENHTGPSL